MFDTSCSGDSCGPRQRFSAVLLSSLPFIVSFLLVATAVSQKLWPLLSGGGVANGDSKDVSPVSPRASRLGRTVPRPSARHLAGFTFSTNFALSAVLVELILCDISNALNPAARSLVLKVTLPSLLFLLILVAPALELHSMIAAAGWNFTGTRRTRLRTAWLIEIAGLACWLWLFWYLGKGLLGLYLEEESYMRTRSFSEGCLERIGIIGIALMALLSGFAAVSAVWHTLAMRSKPVTEADIARKSAGLSATDDMLLAKRSRLRAVQRKMSETPGPDGFMGRVMGSIRGNADATESRTLQLEIAGLETMRVSLSNSLLSLQTRRHAQLRGKTPVGRLCNVGNYIFAVYCAYRIGSALLDLTRRFILPSTGQHASSDPVTVLLSVVAKHWDPTIDRAAWSRSISFLLSGFMLLASFNSALQTFLLLARAFPTLLRSTLHANLALLVSQVSATYVISSALLLRSNLPDDVRGGISEALGSPLDVGFVGKWFEGWFISAVGLTCVGIWLSRRWKAPGELEDDIGDETVELGRVEMGKIS
ncbi:hypothetical protein NA57DRAFT_67061 [Rhizodiscina lignyota]|uniref:Abscisic acid G-protein coupled receptor-like domain-containing protein n=1 Tax=Rhizodiscina lignyota TaxID=1504668 RepID=A0A9P4IE08_9PEZI|nr:hypothetical protein NA57DRAFT_67061 [Rhizodiscina lignyota]